MSSEYEVDGLPQEYSCSPAADRFSPGLFIFSSLLILQIWLLDMGMATGHSWLYTSLHICCTLQVPTTTWHGLGLCTGTIS